MFIEINAGDGDVTLALREAADVRSLRVATTLGSEDLAAVLAVSGLGTVVEDHAWLNVSALRSLSAVAAGHAPAAAEGLTAMLEFAGRHGWLNPGGTHVRAHIADA